jgi:integrase
LISANTSIAAGIQLQGRAYNFFINAIKSPKSKTAYATSLRRYLNHLRLTEVDDLLVNSTNPRLIESQIIDYVMTLRSEGIAYATVNFLVAPILTFYVLNDVTLNKRKITRYFGERKRVVKDRAYTPGEIYKALQTADLRMKVIILSMASGGQRIGSLADITLGNLTFNKHYGIFKVVVYEGTNNEYYCFTTREAANAMFEYLFYRQRSGEKISFNQESGKWEPENTPLLREQFDATDILHVRRPRPIVTNAIRSVLLDHLIRCGLRAIEHPAEPNSIKRVRKSVALGNGFRKFAISAFSRAKINHDIRQMLVDHKGGYLDESYLRLTEEEVLEEYLKAEPFLTIDPNVRLTNENKILKIEVSKVDGVLNELAEMRKAMGLE